MRGPSGRRGAWLRTCCEAHAEGRLPVEVRPGFENIHIVKRALWPISDIHLELTRDWNLPAPPDRPSFNVLIVAGDLLPRAERGVRWSACPTAP